MTNRHRGYIITLEENIREDDAERLINALEFLVGSGRIKPVVDDAEKQMIECKVRIEMREKLLKFISENF